MKSKNVLLVSISIMVLSVAISFVYADEKVDLKLRLEKGQTYKSEVVQDFKIRQIENGQQKDTRLITKIKYIYDIEDVDTEGNAWIKVTYHLVYAKDEETSTGNNVEYDSSNRTDVVHPELIAFDALPGKSFSILVSPDGIIKDIRGADAIQKAMIEKIPPKQEGEISFNTNDMVKEQFSEQALRETLEENLFAFYPDKPVGVSDTWQKNYTISKNIPPMSMQNIYTLKERKDGIATIDIFSMIQPDSEVTPIQIGLGQIRFKFSGDSVAIVEVNETTGWVIRSKQTSRLRGQAIVTHPQMPHGMVVPISLTYTVTQEPY